MKLNVAIFSIWFSVGMPSFVMGQGATERADSVPTRYEKMMARRMEGWKRLIPDHYKIQFAGSIGAASIGTGGHTGRSSNGRQMSCWAFCLNLKVNIIRPFSL